MDWIGLGLVVLFYLIILFIGIWIARRKGVLKSDSWDEMVLANRQLSLGVGIFTLIATEVGGAFVNGTAEEVYKKYYFKITYAPKSLFNERSPSDPFCSLTHVIHYGIKFTIVKYSKGAGNHLQNHGISLN